MSSRYTAGPTETERCIESLLAVFQRYAGRDSNSKSLSKKEFRTFMDTELGSFTKNQKDPAVIDRMMKKLDMNSDGQVDFSEFLNLIGGLAQACHEHEKHTQIHNRISDILYKEFRFGYLSPAVNNGRRCESGFSAPGPAQPGLAQPSPARVAEAVAGQPHSASASRRSRLLAHRTRFAP
ncbi:putative protein1 [Crotalus adamanteus]|uniref:Protein S100-A11 n=1 Tax=Crotalus adamanteus TaxID=8729 RepID=A0AAW1ALD7_CROAD